MRIVVLGVVAGLLAGCATGLEVFAEPNEPCFFKSEGKCVSPEEDVEMLALMSQIPQFWPMLYVMMVAKAGSSSAPHYPGEGPWEARDRAPRPNPERVSDVGVMTPAGARQYP